MHKAKNAPKCPNIQIAVENFGPIEKAEIDLRPLTVFVGESNTGKTYLAALIYALQRTFEGFARIPSPHSSILLLKQSRFRFQTELDDETLETLKKLNTHEQSFKFSDFPQWLRAHKLRALNNPELFRGRLKRCFNLDSVSELIRFTGNKGNELKVSLKVSEENQPLWNFEMEGSGSGITVGGKINKNMIFRNKNETPSQEILDLDDLAALLHIKGSEISDFYYLPAPRSGIMETRGVIISSLVENATRIGLERFHEDATLSGVTADFLKQIINYDERRVPSDEMSGVAKFLEDKVLRGEIEVRRTAAGSLEFRYRPQKSEQTLPMSRSSSMVSELAPLVLFLRGVVQPGDTLIIEEPEAHLHPAAQTKVALTLARLVRAGVRVIITTHSDWLLEQISNLVREGEVMKLGKSKTEPVTWLTKEEIGAWWFRTGKPVTEIPFDYIEGIEPKDYYNVAEELHNNAVEFQQHLLNEEEFGDDE